MELYLLGEDPRSDGTVVLRGAEARHISRVLRHRPGDRVFATDGRGTEFEIELTEVGPRLVSGRLLTKRLRPREPLCRLTLAQAIIKGDRLSSIVEGAAQLGVARLIPFHSKRTVAGLSQTRLERLRSVAAEAVKCSTGTVIPEVVEPVTLDRVAEMAPDFERSVVAYEEETESKGLKEVLDPKAGSVLLVVGPEGGFEPGEIRRLAASGVGSFSMGPRRFKAETAGVVAAALVFHLVGDLGGTKGKRTSKKGGVSEAWQVLS